MVKFNYGQKVMYFDCSIEQFDRAYKEWQNGKMIQDAFPFLSADEREFILSGTTPEEWNSLFGEDDSEMFDEDDVAF